MLINVLNHTLDMGIGELQEIRGQLDAGRVRLLAVVGDERLTQFPDVPHGAGAGHRSVGPEVSRASQARKA
jgi:tripartite-type tricarboxylate transporter receptor subunit TctC